MTNEPTNAARAEWAKEALTVFTIQTFSGDSPDTMDRGDLESAIGDLIADLLHFAEQQGFETDCILASAALHFEAEQREEARP
ncbi:MAG: hypothetical protein HRU75_09355 [Planctomycetia bacterium]|nr:MAG: hypothetical protein HRU75_09355 [Planctomycetia bacterium]